MTNKSATMTRTLTLTDDLLNNGRITGAFWDEVRKVNKFFSKSSTLSNRQITLVATFIDPSTVTMIGGNKYTNFA